MPMAAPTIADSDRGVSITRSAPKRSCRPSVTRNTPPSRPTSSPRMTIRLSRSISWRRARLMACTMLRCAISEFLQLPGLTRAERCAGMFEHLRRDRREDGFHGQHRVVDGHGRALLHLFPVCLIPELLLCHIPLQSQDRVACFPDCHFIRRAVAASIIGRGMIPYPVGEAFDESRSSSATGLAERLGRGPVDGKYVVAVDLYPFEAVGNSLLSQGDYSALPFQRN